MSESGSHLHGEAGAGGELSGEAIVIGNVGTMSVRNAKYDMYGVMQQAVVAWAGEVNARGGIAGRPIRVEAGDDANDPAEHLRLVSEMVEARKVVAFAGTPAVDTQGASAGYLEEKGVPVVGGALGNPIWGTSPILFPQGLAATRRASMLMHAAATSGKTRFAWLGTPDSGPVQKAKALRGGAAAEAGIEVVFAAELQPAAREYTDVCLAAQQAGAELVTITAEFHTQVRVMEAFARQGLRPVYVTTGTITSEKILDVAGTYMDGAIGISRVVPWMADAPADLQVWREAMKENGLAIDAASLPGWVSGRILEEALRRIAGNITSSAVARELRGLAGDDLGGLVAPLGFSSSPTHPNPGSNCFWTLVAKEGAWTPAASGPICLPSSTHSAPGFRSGNAGPSHGRQPSHARCSTSLRQFCHTAHGISARDRPWPPGTAHAARHGPE